MWITGVNGSTFTEPPPSAGFSSAGTGGTRLMRAIQRMVMSGIVPVTWWSLAAKFQLDPRFADSPVRGRLMAAHQPLMRMSGRTSFAGVAEGHRSAGEQP